MIVPRTAPRTTQTIKSTTDPVAMRRKKRLQYGMYGCIMRVINSEINSFAICTHFLFTRHRVNPKCLNRWLKFRPRFLVVFNSAQVPLPYDDLHKFAYVTTHVWERQGNHLPIVSASTALKTSLPRGTWKWQRILLRDCRINKLFERRDNCHVNSDNCKLYHRVDTISSIRCLVRHTSPCLACYRCCSWWKGRKWSIEIQR